VKGGQKYFTRKRIFTRRKKKTRELWVGLYTEPGLLSCCSWIVRSNTAHLTVCSCCVYTYIYICLSVYPVCILPSFRSVRNATLALYFSQHFPSPFSNFFRFLWPYPMCVRVCVQRPPVSPGLHFQPFLFLSVLPFISFCFNFWSFHFIQQKILRGGTSFFPVSNQRLFHRVEE
jgi:hypothetical protein